MASRRKYYLPTSVEEFLRVNQVVWDTFCQIFMTDVVRDMKLAKKMSNLNKNTRLSYEENLSYSFFEPY